MMRLELRRLPLAWILDLLRDVSTPFTSKASTLVPATVNESHEIPYFDNSMDNDQFAISNPSHRLHLHDAISTIKEPAVAELPDPTPSKRLSQKWIEIN